MEKIRRIYFVVQTPKRGTLWITLTRFLFKNVEKLKADIFKYQFCPERRHGLARELAPPRQLVFSDDGVLSTSIYIPEVKIARRSQLSSSCQARRYETASINEQTTIPSIKPNALAFGYIDYALAVFWPLQRVLNDL